MTTKAQTVAALEIAAAVGEAIRDICKLRGGLGLPEGELYAHLMDRMTLEQFEAVLRVLERAGLVTRSNHLLQWVEPEGSSSTVQARP